jgi:hypothetical protein
MSSAMGTGTYQHYGLNALGLPHNSLISRSMLVTFAAN